MIDLCVAGEQSINDRNADAGADIARETVESGAFSSLLGRKCGECHSAQRHKEKAKGRQLRAKNRHYIVPIRSRCRRDSIATFMCFGTKLVPACADLGAITSLVLGGVSVPSGSCDGVGVASAGTPRSARD